MITRASISALAHHYHTSEFPNIVREYFQHLFLSELYQQAGAERLLFKGGTALRIVYGSPRFSEDLDFSYFSANRGGTRPAIEKNLLSVLSKIEEIGVKTVLKEAKATSGGYLSLVSFQADEYPPVNVALNISARQKPVVKPEADSIASDFVPTYTLLHLPKIEIVAEKVFSALPARHKARDFYDLYFLLRKGMLTSPQKQTLAGMQGRFRRWMAALNFRSELGVLLPADQQAIVKDFPRALEDEMARQLAK